MVMEPTQSPARIRPRPESLDERWQAIAVGFLVEKARRTGSRRTTEVYGRTVARFLRTIDDPAAATPFDVHRFAYGFVAGGVPPSPSTVLGRLAAVSGFYDFACRMEVLGRNPGANVRRPQSRAAPPRGLTISEVTRLLAAIPDTPAGLFDRAIIVTGLLTGLRRSELVGLRLVETAPGQAARYEVRTKGGGVRRRELPAPAWRAIEAARAARLGQIRPGSELAFPISAATLYAHLRRHSEAAGLGRVSPHVLRHTAAKLRRQAGATIEDVSMMLGHRSIATTATYLRRLEDERDDGWSGVAQAIGLCGQGPDAVGGDETRAGSQTRLRPIQAVRQGGCANSRPATLSGGVHAPLPGRESTSGEERHRSTGAARRRARRGRAARSRRTRAASERSPLRGAASALHGGVVLADPSAQRCG